ncbi:MAG: thioredoxin family protein [Euryarchaeota archaeon]|nr:thioredoxin family protein [Euryarchaeota archaeon]MDE1838028.1 thioredoxin family protein [Euryarchaeota archaeon]MDE1880117.1 thioredoxin family protein [Euryarchaeota archaeon]MDE2045045.1 thioredoxin family protein [Thermoplasmata archaeon]
MAELDAFKLNVGDHAPTFRDLPGTDGKKWGLRDFDRSRLLLVVFSCNHCPYAQAWEGRIVEVVRDYAVKGLGTIMINPNETVNYPDDRMDRMIERARAKGYPFPYVRDEDQSVARAYGALVTPHPLLFDKDRRLIFQGKLDDSWQEPSKAKHRFLREALDAGLAGRPVPTPTSSVIGCTVKWK